MYGIHIIFHCAVYPPKHKKNNAYYFLDSKRSEECIDLTKMLLFFISFVVCTFWGTKNASVSYFSNFSCRKVILVGAWGSI